MANIRRYSSADAFLLWLAALEVYYCHRSPDQRDTQAALVGARPNSRLFSSSCIYRQKNLTAADIDRLIEATAAARDVPADSLSGYRNVMVSDLVDGPRSFDINQWAARQVYIALGNFMTSAAVLGIDTCPLEGIEPAGYNKALNIDTKEFTTVVACAAGYRSEADKYTTLKKVRFPKSEVIETL